jgi:hypothetical protein
VGIMWVRPAKAVRLPGANAACLHPDRFPHRATGDRNDRRHGLVEGLLCVANGRRDSMRARCVWILEGSQLRLHPSVVRSRREGN